MSIYESDEEETTPTGITTETAIATWSGSAKGADSWDKDNYSINTDESSDFDLTMANGTVFKLTDLPDMIEDTECTITISSTNSNTSGYIQFQILDSSWESLSGGYYNESSSEIAATVSSEEIENILIAVGDSGYRTITKIEIEYEVYKTKYIQTATEESGVWHCRYIKMLPKNELKAGDKAVFTFNYGNSMSQKTVKVYYTSVSDGTNVITAPSGYGFVIYTIKEIPSSVGIGDITFDASLE